MKIRTWSWRLFVEESVLSRCFSRNCIISSALREREREKKNVLFSSYIYKQTDIQLPVVLLNRLGTRNKSETADKERALNGVSHMTGMTKKARLLAVSIKRTCSLFYEEHCLYRKGLHRGRGGLEGKRRNVSFLAALFPFSFHHVPQRITAPHRCQRLGLGLRLGRGFRRNVAWETHVGHLSVKRKNISVSAKAFWRPFFVERVGASIAQLRAAWRSLVFVLRHGCRGWKQSNEIGTTKSVKSVRRVHSSRLRQ